MKKYLILLISVVSLLVLGCSNEETKILSYLNEKYGSDKEFHYTGETWGGGIGIDNHFRRYTSKSSRS